MTEDELNAFNRTKAPITGNWWEGSGKDSEDNTYLVVLDDADSSQTYSKYSVCLEKLTKLMGSKVPSKQQSAMKMMGFFEHKYTCTGVCKSSLFYYSLDLAHGVPSETCLADVSTEIKSSMFYIGVPALVTGAVMFMIWVF